MFGVESMIFIKLSPHLLSPTPQESYWLQHRHLRKYRKMYVSSAHRL